MNDECFLSDDQVSRQFDYCIKQKILIIYFLKTKISIRTDEKTGEAIRYSTESGHTVEMTSETNYMFKLTAFKQKLKLYLENNIIVPKNYQEALHDQLETLEDLSVSREASRLHWGIQVNGLL